MNGFLVEGLGVSGGGVDQDDYVTNAGAQKGLRLPMPFERTQVEVAGARLPYVKFMRNPTD
jgi:hypothetical protein